MKSIKTWYQAYHPRRQNMSLMTRKHHFQNQQAEKASHHSHNAMGEENEPWISHRGEETARRSLPGFPELGLGEQRWLVQAKKGGQVR